MHVCVCVCVSTRPPYLQEMVNTLMASSNRGMISRRVEDIMYAVTPHISCRGGEEEKRDTNAIFIQLCMIKVYMFMYIYMMASNLMTTVSHVSMST